MTINGSKISELAEISADQITDDTLLIVADSSEGINVEDINKKLKFSTLSDYIKTTSLFPIPFDTQHINPQAFIENAFIDIADKVASQTVNLANVGSFKFDEYGRVYDYIDNNEHTQDSSDEIFMASGTAASWYKIPITSDFNTAQPATIANNSIIDGGDSAGYFSANSYYYPSSAVIYQKINYSDRVNNDYDWTHLFNKDYSRFKRTKVEMFLAPDQSTGNIFGAGKITIDINWLTGVVIGNGLLPSYGNYNIPFIMSGTLVGENNTITGVVDNQGLQYVGAPKLIINYETKTITGLPITTPITPQSTNGNYQNISVSLSIIINNIV
jgi:hypothetical protein